MKSVKLRRNSETQKEPTSGKGIHHFRPARTIDRGFLEGFYGFLSFGSSPPTNFENKHKRAADNPVPFAVPFPEFVSFGFIHL